MSRRGTERNRKHIERKYGKLADSMEAYYHHLDFRPLSDLDDDSFAFIMKKVKGVNMLDLNETEITNKSIQLLPRLEYIKELRLKSCRQIDNGCLDDLNSIKALEFLHVRYTGITIDGLLKLTELPGLKTLMFSDDHPENIKEKMRQLKVILPNCEFVINATPYRFDPE